ncbi:MAG: PD40 domain-containing protein [Anaerolineales bacterium]|nr:PD40 domain-containing protein [Anaerolineales bacterium]
MSADAPQAEEKPTAVRKPKKRRWRRVSLSPVTLIFILVVNLVVLVVLALPWLVARFDLSWSIPWTVGRVPVTSAVAVAVTPNTLTVTVSATASLTPTASNTVTPSLTPTITPSATASSTLPVYTPDPRAWEQGVVILSLQSGRDAHLFIYQPLAEDAGGQLPLTRLTAGPWQDLAPALSADQRRIAFSSNRSGFWDLHVLDLANGQISNLTQTPAYDGAPSFSPDGVWVAYESYVDESLEILLLQLAGDEEPVRLTNHLGADSSPAWSPAGRQIAFVSTRAGRNQIWLADLNQSGEQRFTRLSQEDEQSAAHPVWSPDGRYLAWAAITRQGLHRILIWDSQAPRTPAVDVGSGDWPAFSPDGRLIMTSWLTPQDSYLTAYDLSRPDLAVLAPLRMPGLIGGLLWSPVAPSGDLARLDLPTPTPLWTPGLSQPTRAAGERYNLVELETVQAPYPQLHDLVDESFQALRQAVGQAAGWDLLSNLENAYVPLTTVLSPGMLTDWLYTGRAFAVSTVPADAGWMVVVREDFGLETYWRVFLRTRFQDGSQGRPLTYLPWDFDARYLGEPRPYEQGGNWSETVPAGYWIDLTQLAATYGWERLPALSNWRAAYAAARFNEFVKRDGLGWQQAMLELYPQAALVTATPISTPTWTPTATPFGYRTPTPSPTITLTPSPTPTPTPTDTLTSTPTPSPSVTPTRTRFPTRTPTASFTPTPTP